MDIPLLLLAAAAVLFLLAAVNVRLGSLNVMAAGLFCWALSVLWPRVLS